MKRIVCLTLAVTLVCAFTAIAGKTGDLVTMGMARGLDNMIACPAELTHHTINDVSEYSFVGLVTGPIKGVVFMLCRFFGGAADLVTLGLIPDESSPYRTLMVKPIYLEREVAASQPKAPARPKK